MNDSDGIHFFIDGDHPDHLKPTNSVFGSTAFDRLDQLFTVDGVDEVGSATLVDDPKPIPEVMVDAPEVVAELHADIDIVLAEHAAFTPNAVRSTFEQVAVLAEKVAPARTLDWKTDFILNGPRIDVKATRRFARRNMTITHEGVR